MEEFDLELSFKLSDIMFAGPEERLKDTSYAQPAIVAHSLMAWEAFKVISVFSGLYPTRKKWD